MRISEWSSDVCSSDLNRDLISNQTVKFVLFERGDEIASRLPRHRKRIFARWVAHDVEERTGVDAQHWHAFRSHGRDVERKHGSASLGFPIEEFLAALIFACKAVGAILVPAFDLVKPAGQTIGAEDRKSTRLNSSH